MLFCERYTDLFGCLGYATPSGPGGYQGWSAPAGPQAPPQWGSGYGAAAQQPGYGTYGK